MRRLIGQFAKWLCTSAVLGLGTGQVYATGFNNYIVGGVVVADDASYPFMVSVYFDSAGVKIFEPGCGGTLIADRWVLTAAHCLYNTTFNRPLSVNSVGVLVGEKDLSQRQDSNFIKAKRLIPHPEYDEKTNQFDIGLIELSEPYNAPIAVLPGVDSAVPVLDEPGVVLGWGVVEEFGAQSEKLREVSLPVISNAACFPYYREQFDSRLAFCAGGSRVGGQDSCQGDSGGPLLVTRQNELFETFYVVAGIVSYGDGCARRGVPGVYTRVEAFTDWIKQHASGTLDYVGQPDAQLEDNAQITKLAVNTSVSGQLLSGQVAYFEVTGAKQINLTSDEGDADLFIIDDANFQDISAELLRCASEEDEGVIDVCVIDDEKLNAYAVVYGYLDSRYTISSQLVTNDVNTTLPFESGVQPASGISGSGSGALSGALSLLFLFMCIFRFKFEKVGRFRSIQILNVSNDSNSRHL